jgi:hypothetical protein
MLERRRVLVSREDTWTHTVAPVIVVSADMVGEEELTPPGNF